MVTGVITMEDFITMNSPRYPELVNYMGFAQQIEIEDEDVEMREAAPLYEEHLSFDEMVLGIREGKFFKGRLNVSRVNIAESTV